MTNFDAAPSEEAIIYCDVPDCAAQLSMVFGVSRSLHGWGRMSWYDERGTHDYDLCSQHAKVIKAVLKRSAQ